MERTRVMHAKTFTIGPALATACLAGVCAFALVNDNRALIYILAAALGLAGLLLPRGVAPSLLLIGIALMPTAYLPLSSVITYLVPAAALGLIVVVRHVGREPFLHIPRAWYAVLAIFIAWTSIISIARLGSARSAIWIFDAVLLIGGSTYAAARIDGRAGDLLMRVWAGVSVLLGGFACIEWIMKINPLRAVYATATSPLIQHWSVYRVETTLGHPLMNAAFFGTGATLLGIRVFAGDRRTTVMLGAGSSLIGLVLTFSRGGLIAYGVGMTAGLIVVMFRRGIDWRKISVVLMIAGIAFVAVPFVLGARGTTTEAGDSAAYRNVVWQASLRVLTDDNYLGSGAATSGVRLPGVTIENSIAQLGISLGAPGLITFALLIIIPGYLAVRRGRVETAAALCTFFTMAASFNLLESNFNALAIPALVLIHGLSGPEDPARGDELALSRSQSLRVGR